MRRNTPAFAIAALTASFALASVHPAWAESKNLQFGDDASDYAFDSQCDDPRFFGIGMAAALSDDGIGHDATDCRHHYEVGSVQLWDEAQARLATDCARVVFGDNGSEWAGDGECDDPRFIGRGVDSIVTIQDLGHDADDCRAACEAGTALLRNY